MHPGAGPGNLKKHHLLWEAGSAGPQIVGRGAARGRLGEGHILATWSHETGQRYKENPQSTLLSI